MVFVDGFEMGDEEHEVLRDRQQLAGDGIIIAVVTVERPDGRRRGAARARGPRLPHDEERQDDLLAEAGEALSARLAELAAEHVTGQRLIKEDMHERARPARLPAHQAAAADHAGRRRGLSARRDARDSPPGVEGRTHGGRPHEDRPVSGRARSGGARRRSRSRAPRRGAPARASTAISAASWPPSAASRSPSSWPSSCTSAGPPGRSAAGWAARLTSSSACSPSCRRSCWPSRPTF